MKCLHITNGDIVVDGLTASGVGGTFLPWRDVLHDGPVPRLPLEELSAVRAEFIADCGWGRLQDLLADFRRRDLHLQSWREFDEVVLWFEHDLYDQLQMLQILSWFAHQAGDHRTLRLICIDRFSGIHDFHGLGQLQPSELASLWDTRRPVTATMCATACNAWVAFTAREPSALARLAGHKTESLPFLAPALRRWCQEFPSAGDGLGRSRRAALATLVDGPLTPACSFSAYQRSEPARYLGDWCYWRYLQELACCRVPLIGVDGAAFARYRTDRDGAGKFSAQQLRLTEAGRRVLHGEQDHIDLNGIDSWRGGVHLHTQDHWRWDQARESFQHVMLA